MSKFASSSARILPQARLAGPTLWVIAIMVALSVIAISAALALSNIAANANEEIEGGLTVQIIEGAPSERERQAEMALAMLINNENVERAERVSDAELAALLEPWLGNAIGEDETAIPTPALIDVRLRGPVTEVRMAELREGLADIAPAAQLNSQAQWLGPVFEAISSLKWLALALVLLLSAISAAAIWLAARSALGANRETIEVIHHLGASDGQIAGIFQRSVGIDAVIGATAGTLLGVAAMTLLGRQFAGLGSGLVAGGGLQQLDWVLIALVPIATILLALLTARVAVISVLRRLL